MRTPWEIQSDIDRINEEIKKSGLTDELQEKRTELELEFEWVML